MSRLIDLTGQRFGRLVVLERKGSRINKNNMRRANWLCKCDCGTLVETTTDLLKSGHKMSCGCLQKDILVQRNKSKIKYNHYDLSKEYGIGYTFDNKPFYFDKEDYEKIKNFTWHESNGYLISHVYKNGKRTTIRLHRLILNIQDNLFIDHINHNPFDNRKINLRIVDNSKNQMNKVIAKNNTSTVKGVHFDKLIGMWVARIGVNGKRIRLGKFTDFNEAVKVRKEAEEKYHKEYSYDNSIKYAEIIAK